MTTDFDPDGDVRCSDMTLTMGVGVTAFLPRRRLASEVGREADFDARVSLFSDVFEFNLDNVAHLLPVKRKSPVTDDRDEKRTRIAAENRVVKVGSDICHLSPCPARGDATVLTSPASKIQSQAAEVSADEASVDLELKLFQSEAPVELHTPLCISEARSNLHEKDQTAMLLSRWASDTDSFIVDSCNLTLGRVEIRSEDLVAPSSTPYSSDGEGCCVSGEEFFGVDDHASSDKSSDDEEAHSQIDESAVMRYKSIDMLKGGRSAAEFTKLDCMGEGSFGVVYRARDEQSGEIVAVKKLWIDKLYNKELLRETNILMYCNHPSIVGVKELLVEGCHIFMVMECLEYDLWLLLKATEKPFGISEVKYLVKRLLEGVKYLHDNWILHGDLKCSNILVNKEGELKICDFGLSQPNRRPLKQYPLTRNLVSLWYRAPELLLGQMHYCTTIDIWSIGCIMGEVLAKEVLFQGEDEVDQLTKIFGTLGTPNETDWPGVSKLPWFRTIQVEQRENLLREKFSGNCSTESPMLDASGLDLLTKLLTYDPAKRITADDALSHEWFKDYPEPRPYKPSSAVHEKYTALRQQQDRGESGQASWKKS